MKFEKNLIFHINQEIFEKLKKCVLKASPNESFGLILGPKPLEIPLENPGEFQYHFLAEAFECIESDDSSPVHFMLENVEELNRIIKNANQKYNMRVLSIFHSHPGGAYPSGFDVNYMKFLDEFHNVLLNSPRMLKTPIKNQIWTIMDASNNELNGFIYLQGEYLQVNVQIKSK